MHDAHEQDRQDRCRELYGDHRSRRGLERYEPGAGEAEAVLSARPAEFPGGDDRGVRIGECRRPLRGEIRGFQALFIRPDRGFAQRHDHQGGRQYRQERDRLRPAADPVRLRGHAGGDHAGDFTFITNATRASDGDRGF